MSAATLRNLIRGFDLKSTGKWFLLASLVGAASGLGAVLFQVLGQVVVQYSLVSFAGFVPGEASGEQAFFPHAEHEISLAMIVVIMGLGAWFQDTSFLNGPPKPKVTARTRPSNPFTTAAV